MWAHARMWSIPIFGASVGLQMLHNIMKQNRGNFNRIPIIRKLLKVGGFSSATFVLTWLKFWVKLDSKLISVYIILLYQPECVLHIALTKKYYLQHSISMLEHTLDRPSLSQIKCTCDFPIGLVSKSANGLADEAYESGYPILEYVMRWQSTSICLVLPWNMSSGLIISIMGSIMWNKAQ